MSSSSPANTATALSPPAEDSFYSPPGPAFVPSQGPTTDETSGAILSYGDGDEGYLPTAEGDAEEDELDDEEERLYEAERLGRMESDEMEMPGSEWSEADEVALALRGEEQREEYGVGSVPTVYD
jgi:hypothetical protein